MTKYNISIRQFCKAYDLEEGFVMNFIETEMIEIETRGDDYLIKDEHLGLLEKMVRLHRDLGINEAGLETIHHLLERMEEMQEEIRSLRNRLRLYE
ncbi:chaperone modulator CbpM [Robertkochia aurantiaca]|uniref:chaperone modulator CbpM n=1 Tax=Robertkochia aurantiaca TaxID=2873700 RepID=UPI001CCAEAC9|nr:chaperone modulator CbpM [Robertkochia sp. 3YJGBD-33]